MRKFYVYDMKVSPPKYVLFDSVPAVVAYLEEYVKRAIRKDRKTFMYEMAELGHGDDDMMGVNFTRMLSEYVNIGIVQHGKTVKCDIHAANEFAKEEYGN